MPGLARLDDPVPHARVLSNGRYTVLCTGAGSGFSTCLGNALTAWSGDRTEDREGIFFYLRDRADGRTWSAGHQPTCRKAQAYGARSRAGSFVLRRLDHGIETRVEIAVDPESEAEIRRIRIANRSRRSRTIELTSFLEVVLQAREAYESHPAFSKLFLQTEALPEHAAVLASRRPRSAGEIRRWLAVVLAGEGPLELETDRVRFVGRGHSLLTPLALSTRDPLSGATGNVLDPVIALRRTISIRPGRSAVFHFAVAYAEERERALVAAVALANPVGAARAFHGAEERERALRVRLRIAPERAEWLQEISGGMLYGDPRLGADAATLERRAHAGRSAAPLGFRHGPLRVVAALGGRGARRLVREAITARSYWTELGLPIDLLLVGRGARQLAGSERGATGEGITAVESAELDAALIDRTLASADLVLQGAFPGPGSVATRRRARAKRGPVTAPAASTAPPHEALELDNGYGGFADGGGEYVLRLGGAGSSLRPPMPWINVVANESFGFLASESGGGYTWSGNSQQNRLTPWSNDPVVDPHGEAFYLRDDESGAFWSPQPGPATLERDAFEVRHGWGYTSWRSSRDGLDHEVLSFVPPRDPLKLTRLTLTNRSNRVRRLSAFSFQRLVLGVLPSQAIVSEFDARCEALLARNATNEDFAGAIAFAAAPRSDGSSRVSFTADRGAFLGRNGSMRRPAGVADGRPLDGRTGAGLDPCAALQTEIVLAPGETAERTFAFGQASDLASVRALVERYRDPGAVGRALEEVRRSWVDTVSAIRVRTPAPAIDHMVNGWLLYQVAACRLWGRSAFYQSGGAFGFRDQLQDAASLVYSRPDLTRAQILLHAAHQFVEGDVLHWWHPPVGRGTRTRCSDDLLWLPYVTAFYVDTTGDSEVLEERVGFLTARTLADGEDEAFLQPSAAAENADLYEHCCRAIDRSLTRGPHGLPLIGTCDWNDGMNRVGREGRGESVWLAFFLDCVLGSFLPICERRRDRARLGRYRDHRAVLRDAVERSAWDGEWYRRAYYDDGTPLGSAQNSECRIDALAQAWATISRAVPAERASQALEAADRELVSESDGIIRLLTPPFDRTAEDPGYIKGYVPGIRENGGQYTHGALWLVRAFAESGRRDRAARLLEMLSPVHHARDRRAADRYQVEPYVVAADVYGAAPHVGRGGWTWYTGSAGWMYRVAVETILGLTVERGTWLRIAPRIPDDWPGFALRYSLPDRRTVYEITVDNPQRDARLVTSAECDGAPTALVEGKARVPLLADGRRHAVRVSLGGQPVTATPSSANR